MRYALVAVVGFGIISTLLLYGQGSSAGTRRLVTTGMLAGRCVGNTVVPPGTYIPGLGAPISLDCDYGDDGTDWAMVLMPSSAVLTNLQVRSELICGMSPEGQVFTLMVNRAPAALTCTVGADGTCSDTTHRVSLNAGDRVGVYVTAAQNGGMPAFSKLRSETVSIAATWRNSQNRNAGNARSGPAFSRLLLVTAGQTSDWMRAN